MKNIIVTGGTRGLGCSIVKILSRNSDYRVIAIGRRLSDELRTLVSENKNVVFKEFDLQQTSSISGLVLDLTKEFGRIYGLVNNAAIGNDGVLATMHEKDIHDVLNVNIESAILFTKYAVRSMLLNKIGRVINISSIIAKTGYNGLSVYAASKAALEGFSRSLAREVGRANITVNCVAPGYMETAMTGKLDKDSIDKILRRSPMRRLVSTEEVAEVVHFLMGESGAAITGTVYTVDAGSTA